MSDNDLINSPMKENLDPSTPPRSPLKANRSGSPSQHKSMWDSGDPNRNPPPLPVSPQMIRISPNKNKNLSPSSVGKLQFAPIDNLDIEHQLKRIIDSQSTLRSIIVSVDTSVKQTQLDLENLVERSSNNNSHLKDLVQNVKSSLNPDEKSVSKDESLLEAISKALAPLREHTERSVATEDQIIQKLDSLESNVKNSILSGSDSEVVWQGFKSSLAEIALKIDNFKSSSSERANELSSLKETLSKTNEDSAANVNASIEESKASVIETLVKVENTIKGYDLKMHFDDISNRQAEILKQLEGSKLQTTEGLDAQFVSLKSSHEMLKKELIETFKGSQDEQSKHVTDIVSLVKSLQSNSELPKTLEESLSNVTESYSNIPKIINQEFSKFQETITENHRISETISQKFESDLMEKLKAFESKADQLKEELTGSNKNKELTDKEIENRDLLIQLKDKEITELKSQLEDAKKKSELKESIIELTQTKTQLESKYELLNQAYSQRYKEFEELSTDYDALQLKLSNLSLDRLRSILGSATIMKISNDNTVHEKNESPRKNVLGSRIMSTNSYLNTDQTQLTPKSKKKYEFDSSTKEFEEKENV